ncbi:MAG: CHASE domain-containing protein [Deltaproteobacteria bacterium]|nr:CHASE domain-containing protein [Deltaproteobacteria bacterium]
MKRKAPSKVALAVFVAAIATTGCLYWAIHKAENRYIQHTVAQDLNICKNEIGTRIDVRVKSLVRMAERWGTTSSLPSTVRKALWEADAANYIRDYPGFQAVEWADPDLRVRWKMPKEGNELAQDLDLRFEKIRREGALKALATRQPVMTSPVELLEKVAGFILYVPIFHREQFKGFILGVFRVQDLFDHLIPSSIAHEYSVLVSTEGHPFYKDTGSDGVREWAARSGFNVHGALWGIEIAPTVEMLGRLKTILPVVVLLAGALLSFLLALAVGLAFELRVAQRGLEQRVTDRTAELSRRSEELQKEIEFRSQTEQRFKQTAEELARSNQELEQFAYAASHDLKEPLRMVSSYVDLLSKRYRGKLDGEADEFIHFAVSGAKKMQSLIDDLLTYSRVGRAQGKGELVDCNAIVEECLSTLRLAIQEAGVTIEMGDLPQIIGDKLQIALLFQNLIGNAIKFRSNLPPKVQIHAEFKDNAWVFSITDNGIGFEMSYAERIFRMFQRLHPDRQYPGTGVGLAICKKIVERHNGKIWVESEPGRGSTFYFTALPTHLKDSDHSSKGRPSWTV